MAGNDYPTKDERDVLNKLDELDREGDMWRNAVDNELWERYDAEYRGEAPWLGRRIPKFLVPAIRTTIDRRNALLTETKPVIKVTARKPGLQKTCEILTKTIEAAYDEYSVELQLERAVQISSVVGAVFGGVPWNRWARFGEGDIEPGVYDPRSIAIDPLVRQSYSLGQVAQYTIKTDIWPLWEIQRRFPGRGMLVKQDRAISSTNDKLDTGGRSSSWRSRLARSWKFNRDELQQGPIPRARVRQYLWRDPVQDATNPELLKYPDGRLIIRGGQDVILKDEPNPYWGGDLDLEMLDLKPAIDSPWGSSEVEAIRRVNEAINRIGNQFVDNAILGGNLVVLTDSDALEPDTVQKITNAAGLVITKRFGRTLEWKPPPAMPPHMLQFIQIGLALIEQLIGLSDSTGTGGRGRVEVRSGAQIEGLQSAAQVLVRMAARRVEGFMERLGQLWIKRIFQFYTDDRLITFLGPDGDFHQFEFERAQLMKEITDRAVRNISDPKHHSYKANASSEELQEAIEHETRVAWRDFSFRIIPGSSLATTKIQRAQLAMQLAQGQMLPRRDVLIEAGYDNPDEKMQQAHDEMQKFGPPPPPPKGGKKKAA